MSNSSLESLLAQIESGTISERNSAFEKLELQPFESIRDFLFDGLHNNHHRIRSNCARILGEKGDETIIFPLLQIMSDDSWAIRSTAQEALKSMNESVVLPALGGIISASSGNVPLLKSLAAVLASFTHRDAASLLVSVIQNNSDASLIEVVTKSLGKRTDELSLSHLFHLLAHEKWNVRQAAVKSISRMPFKNISDRLKKELANSNRFIHLSVIEILIGKGDDDVIDLMADALDSNNDLTRENALKVLSEIGNDECYSLMISLIGDMNDSIRSTAIANLANVNSVNLVKQLQRCLKSSNKRLKHGAIDTLGRMGTEETINILSDLLSELDDDDKVIILESLAGIGNRRCIQLIIKHSRIPGYTREVAEILHKLDQDLAIQQLVNMLDSDDMFATAVEALTQMEKLKVLRNLSNRLGTGTPNQQLKAIETMGLIGFKEGIPYLEKIVEGGFSGALVQHASDALKRLKTMTH